MITRYKVTKVTDMEDRKVRLPEAATSQCRSWHSPDFVPLMCTKAVGRVVKWGVQMRTRVTWWPPYGTWQWDQVCSLIGTPELLLLLIPKGWRLHYFPSQRKCNTWHQSRQAENQNHRMSEQVVSRCTSIQSGLIFSQAHWGPDTLNYMSWVYIPNRKWVMEA